MISLITKKKKKTYVEIHVGEKMCRNAYNVIKKNENICLNMSTKQPHNISHYLMLLYMVGPNTLESMFLSRYKI